MSESNQSEIVPIDNNNVHPDIIKIQGAGKAYQSVAQSMALAIQDATDHLRNISTVASTAVAVATEMMIADPDKLEQYVKIINQAQETVNKAATTFKDIGTDAGDVLDNFPSGSD